MLQKYILFIFLTTIPCAYAQLNPEGTSNNDLRGNKEVFSIKYQENKNQMHFFVNQTAMGDFHIGQNENDQLKKTIKLDSQLAKTIDETFVDKFVEMKYMMTNTNKYKCDNYFELNMRGDDLKVCGDDDGRTNLVNELLKLFKQKLI